jgi:tight adherence protein B
MLLGAVLCLAAVWTAILAATGRPVPLVRRSRDAEGRPRRLDRQIWLSQAGASVTPRQFLGVSAATGLVAFLGCYALSRTEVVSLIPAVAASLVPYGYWASERRKRSAAQVRAWPEALRHLLAGLQRGLTLHQGLEELAVSGPQPLRPVMARYGRLERQVGPERAMETIRAELADTTSDRVLLALELAFTKGKEIVTDILAQLADDASEDLVTAEKLATAAVMPTINAWATFCVPYVILIFLCATEGFFRSFYSSGIGLAVVAVGALMSTVGMLIIRRMGQPVPEYRVFETNDGKGAGSPFAVLPEVRP